MRVFAVPTWHPAPDRPLFANWVRPHIEATRRHGIETIVLQVDVRETGDASQTAADAGTQWLEDQRIYRALELPPRRHRRTRWHYRRLLDAYTEALAALYDEAEQRHGAPDVVHAHVSLPGGYAAARVAQARRVPALVTEHYTGFESDARFPWRVGRFVREMGRRLQGFYAVSPGFAERIARTGLVEVTGVLPNPIDTDLFQPAPGALPERFEIVTAGGLTQRKGADMLLDAVGGLPATLDWRLHVYGTREQAERYARWLDASPWSERVLVHGPVPQQELIRAFSRAHAYVVSSRLETANVAMLQAMACGCPVVTTACGAPETLVDASVARVVPSGDADAMGRALAEVAATPFKRVAVRDFVVERYSVRNVASEMALAYAAATRAFEDDRT